MCELLDPFFDVTPASVLFDHLRFSAYVVMIREWGRGHLFYCHAREGGHLLSNILTFVVIIIKLI